MTCWVSFPLLLIQRCGFHGCAHDLAMYPLKDQEFPLLRLSSLFCLLTPHTILDLVQELGSSTAAQNHKFSVAS